MAALHPADSDLLELASGALAPAVRDQVRVHLDGCQRCKNVLAILQETTSPSGERLLSPGATERTHAGDPLIGQLLGEYKVIERLGQGGMGVLYRGEQPDIGKSVAIKVLLNSIAADPVLVERMLDEARAVNAARHPNIVDIFSFGRVRDGRPYLVMELLQGSSLASVLHEAGRLSPAQTMRVLSQAFAALEAAHAAGVIHRDLKPDNIFIDPRPEGWNVTLLDFGLAKREGAMDRGLTSPGMVMGTPGYMAPEQVRGSGTVSAKTDCYAMGVVAWTLLVGREPFGTGSVVEVMHRHLSTPAPSISEAVPGVPAGLAKLVMELLEKDPDRRPSATQARARLVELQQGQSAAPQVPARSSAWAYAAIAVVGTALAAVGWWVNAAPPDVARSPEQVAPYRIAPPLRAPPPEELVPQPVAPAIAPLGGNALTWRCSKVTQVGEVDEVIGGAWYLVVAKLEGEPLMLVSAPKTGRGLQQLKRVQKELRECRATDGTITARDTASVTTWAKHGTWNGVSVVADALTIAPPPP